MDGYQVLVTVVLKGPDNPFQLPGGGIGPQERKMPGYVVLEDNGPSGIKMVFYFRQLAEFLNILKDIFGLVFKTATLEWLITYFFRLRTSRLMRLMWPRPDPFTSQPSSK